MALPKAENFEIIDAHLHVYDLKLKASFPNQNWTIVDFPDPVNEKAIAMDATQVRSLNRYYVDTK